MNAFIFVIDIYYLPKYILIGSEPARSKQLSKYQHAPLGDINRIHGEYK